MKGLEKRLTAIEASREPLFSGAEIESILVSVLDERPDMRARKLPIELFDELLADGDDKCLMRN